MRLLNLTDFLPYKITVLSMPLLDAYFFCSPSPPGAVEWFPEEGSNTKYCQHHCKYGNSLHEKGLWQRCRWMSYFKATCALESERSMLLPPIDVK